MRHQQHISPGFNCWAVFSETGLVSTFQSRQQAERAVQQLGGAGYTIQHGKLERSGGFISSDLCADKTR
jgi:hypothetical protein